MLNYRKDGAPFWIELTIAPVFDESGAFLRCVTTGRDVTQRRATAQRLSQLQAAVQASVDGIAVIDAPGELRFANDAFARLHGHGGGEALRGTAWQDLYDPRELARFQQEVLPALQLHQRWRGEALGRCDDGSTFPQELSISMLPDGGMVLVVRDITDRREMEDSLRQMSLSDQLTGLYNRRGFFMLAQQHLNVARTAPGHAILFYFDLNDFKDINDSCGHAVGDEALCEMAAILRETFRDSDILGRLGGDEFVALAANCLDASGDVLRVRLEQRLAAHNAIPGRRYVLSIGKGAVRFEPAEPLSLQQLLDVADRELYDDKRASREARGPR